MTKHDDVIAIWVAKQLAQAPPTGDQEREAAVRILARPADRQKDQRDPQRRDAA